MQLNGVQMNTKVGMDFNTQYSVPDTGLTNNTTLANNPLYNLLQVVFGDTKSENTTAYNANDLFSKPVVGLNSKVDKGWVG
jgi:hypothetical protein